MAENTFTIVAPISYRLEEAPRQGFQKPSRRLFMYPANIEDVPAELFATKMSQSTNPALKGKLVFKHIGIKVSDETGWVSNVPKGVEGDTDLEEVKRLTVARIKGTDIQFSVAVNLAGKFANITTPEGDMLVFDNDKFPATAGLPNYYYKSDVPATIELQLTPSKTPGYSDYYRVRVSTTESPDNIFTKKGGQAQVWGEDDYDDGEVNTASAFEPASTPTPSAPAEESDGAIW